MKRDFISLADLDSQALAGLLDLASALKRERAEGQERPLLAGKTLAMIFQKPSLRTRASFDLAMNHLGGHALYLGPDEIQLGKRESVADVARVISRYADAITARVFAHTDVTQLAEWSSVPVINALSDYNHPCQGLADLVTIREKLDDLSDVSLAYIGDGNNVLVSLMFGAALTGMRLFAATPAGYEPDAAATAQAKTIAAETGGDIDIRHDPREAVRDAQVIYTDTWTSMGQEAEANTRRQIFRPYQVNAALIAAAPKLAGVMHCLPAHRGEEITDEVADGPFSWLFDQAENRLHAQKAVLVDLLVR